MMRTLACSCLLLFASFTRAQQLQAQFSSAAFNGTPANAIALDPAMVARVMRALERLPKLVYTFDNLPPALHGHAAGLEPLTRSGDFYQEGMAPWLEEPDRTILEPPLCAELRQRIEALEERLRILGATLSDKPPSTSP